LIDQVISGDDPASVVIAPDLLHWFWILVGVATIAVGAYRYWTARNRNTAEQADATAPGSPGCASSPSRG